MSKLINLGWVFSIIAFLGALLFNYAYLQEPVQVYNSNAGQFIVSREMFFYGGLGVFLLTNSVFISFSRLLGLRGFFKQSLFKNSLLVWFNGLSLIVNIFFILIVFFITALNNSDFMSSGRFYLLIYPIVALMVVWVLSLLVIILKRKTV